jgi:hypothetical protein
MSVIDTSAINDSYNIQLGTSFNSQNPESTKSVAPKNIFEEEEQAKKSLEDSLIISENAGLAVGNIETGIYTKQDVSIVKTGDAKVDALKSLEADRLNKFNEFVQKMLQNQKTSDDVAGALFEKVTAFLPQVNEETGGIYGVAVELNPTQEDIDNAKAAVDEGGEYSVDNVATRIMDMAKALSQGDESRFSLLKGAVEEGFKYVTDLYGDKTPEITKKTYEEVMARFDNWEREINDKKSAEMQSLTVGEVAAQAAADIVSGAKTTAPVGATQTDKQVEQGNIPLGLAAI